MSLADRGAVAIDQHAAAVEPLPWIDPAIDRGRIGLALLVTLLISRLPEIVARELLGQAVPWMGWAIVVLTILLWVAARFLPVLRPFERSSRSWSWSMC